MAQVFNNPDGTAINTSGLMVPSTVTGGNKGVGTINVTQIYQNGTALAEYAAGNWTPVLGGTVATGTQTYSTQIGRFVRNGNLVTAWCQIVLSAKDGATSGDMQVTGLPATASAISGFNPYVPTFGGMWNFASGYTFMTGFAIQGSTRVVIQQGGDNVPAIALTASDFVGTSTMLFCATYSTGLT